MARLTQNWPPASRHGSRNPTPDENLMSPPPLPTLENHVSSKARKAPTVTPRTFTRFFTPRSSKGRSKRISAARQALRDITGTASDRKASNQQFTAAGNGVTVFEDAMIGFTDIVGSRKKRKPVSPDTTPDRSSPLKRKCGISRNVVKDDDHEGRTDCERELTASLEDAKDGTSSAKLQLLKPIVRATMGGPVGRVLRRELNISCNFRGTRAISYCNTSKPGCYGV